MTEPREDPPRRPDPAAESDERASDLLDAWLSQRDRSDRPPAGRAGEMLRARNALNVSQSGTAPSGTASGGTASVGTEEDLDDLVAVAMRRLDGDPEPTASGAERAHQPRHTGRRARNGWSTSGKVAAAAAVVVLGGIAVSVAVPGPDDAATDTETAAVHPPSTPPGIAGAREHVAEGDQQQGAESDQQQGAESDGRPGAEGITKAPPTAQPAAPDAGSSSEMSSPSNTASPRNAGSPQDTAAPQEAASPFAGLRASGSMPLG